MRKFVVWRTSKSEYGTGSWAIIDGMVFVRTAHGQKATQIGGSESRGPGEDFNSRTCRRMPRLHVINLAVSSRSSGSVRPLRKSVVAVHRALKYRIACSRLAA